MVGRRRLPLTRRRLPPRGVVRPLRTPQRHRRSRRAVLLGAAVVVAAVVVVVVVVVLLPLARVGRPTAAVSRGWSGRRRCPRRG